MLKIATWGKNKPILPAVISQIIAIASQTLYRYLSRVREFKNIKDIPPPNSTLWLSFYYRSNHLDEKITANLTKNFNDERLTKHISELATKLNEISIDQSPVNRNKSKLAKTPPKVQKRTIEQILIDQIESRQFFDAVKNLSSESLPLLSVIYNFNIKLIEDDIEEEKNLEAFSNPDDQKLFTPEMLFFLKVIFPCWIFYNDHHSILLRKARQGDTDSLQKILTLDKTLIGDRLINRQITTSISADPLKFELITRAIQRKPKELNTLSRLKTSLAGLISVVSEELGHRFTAPQIKELFDAVAVDYGYDELIDSDLPDSPWTFSKAIQRERPFWQNSI